MADVFRTGRSVGRTVYLRAADETLIGVFDTPALADFAVRAMNAAVDAGWPLPYEDEP